MPSGEPWPRVTVVTPSYNQARFLEGTIRSVLLQGYPNLEYIVIDGGSTDGSAAIIRRYEPWLSYWISESDNGQAHAINKGFQRATGTVLAWLNSDDRYEPGAIAQAVATLMTQRAHVVYANCRLVDSAGELVRLANPSQVTIGSLLRYWREDHIPPQPSMFFTAEALRSVGWLDEGLVYAMDYDLCLKLINRYPFLYVDAEWSVYTIHADSKTGQGWDVFEPEWYRVSLPYWKRQGTLFYLQSLWLHRREWEARLLLDRANLAYHARDLSLARRCLHRAVLARPEELLNRRVWSLYAHSRLSEEQIQAIKAILRARLPNESNDETS